MDKQLTDLEAELLAALKIIEREVSGWGITKDAILRVVRAAIAKAEGR